LSDCPQNLLNKSEEKRPGQKTGPFYQKANAFDVSGAEVASGPKSASPEISSSSCSRWRARLTRLLMVPTAQPQISAAS